MKSLLSLLAMLMAINFCCAQNTYPWPATGNIGIGTTTPVTINSSSALFPSATPLVEMRTGSGATDDPYSEFVTIRHLHAGTTAVSRQLGLLFKLSSETNITESNKMGGIMLESDNAHSNTPYLSFITNNARRLTIDQAGHIGIGTTAPTHAFTLASGATGGSAATGMVVYNTTDQTTNYERSLSYWNSNTYTIATQNAGTGLLRNIKLSANGSALTLGAGIGTESAALEFRKDGTSDNNLFSFTSSGLVQSSTNQNAVGVLPLVHQSGTAGFRMLWISPFEQTTGSGSKYLIDAGTNTAVDGNGTHTSKFTVSDNGNSYFAGNVGIGTTSPQNKLDIQGGNASIYNTGAATGVNIGSGATGKTYLSLSTSADANGYGVISSVSVSGSTYGNTVINPNGGNVGIGTTSPGAPLQVQTSDGTGNVQLGSWITSPSDGAIYLNNDFTNGGNYNLLSSPSGPLYINRPGGLSILFREGNGTDQMAIASGGNVGIGTTTPDTKLAVNGTIHSKEVKVDMLGWPDYVFKPQYKLPSLSDVKSYIDQNQHLPDMPSENEVAKDGVNLGEMNKLLLKKVEELTLYMIEQQKQMELFKQTVQNLSKKQYKQ